MLPMSLCCAECNLKARSVKETFADIRRGVLKVSSLPSITVLDTGQRRENGRHEVISLNNRRLWVLKQCKAAGIIRFGECQLVREDARAAYMDVSTCLRMYPGPADGFHPSKSWLLQRRAVSGRCRQCVSTAAKQVWRCDQICFHCKASAECTGQEVEQGVWNTSR